MKKSKLFKGLTATFASLLAICSIMSKLASDRQGDINQFLKSIGWLSQESGDLTGAYPSNYSSTEEMEKAKKEHMIQTETEGSVLLKNDNNALPLNANCKVTLLGNASYYSIYHGGSGGPTNSGVSLYDALTEEGVEVNEKIYNVTKENGKTISDGDISEVDASIYNDTDFNGYKDAAIVVLGRFSGEENDFGYKTDETLKNNIPVYLDKDGVPELSFHDREKALMEKVKNAGFSKIIVLLNTATSMDLGWLDEYNVDGCMWIGYPGSYGMNAVAKMLVGKANPSGHLVDTFATSSLSSPAMRNFGDFTFSDLANNGAYHQKYLIYAEGIYIGYKYYETRYADSILNPNSGASSTIGVYASTNNWNYDEEVMYPFGYGLSYTNFKQELKNVQWNLETHTVTATVNVTNMGDVAGKDAVELYASLPYEKGQAEKSAIQLIGFTKTDELAAKESKEYTIEVSDYMFATYDKNATNGADSSKNGCYVFDAGDYIFAIGESSHDALNNTLALSGYTSLTDGFSHTVTGNASNARKINLESYDNVTYSKNPTTGVIVSNQFDDIDYNYYKDGAITYMTRSDYNTYPTAYTDLKASDDSTGTIAKVMSQKASTLKPSDSDPKISDFKYGQVNNIKFVEMKDVDYSNDEKWDSFIDQLTVNDLTSFPAERMGNNAIESVSYPANDSGDGPDGLQQTTSLFPSQTLCTATFNIEIAQERGKFLAEDGKHNAQTVMVYGGGANMHRTPYGGRNFEYFSEDGIIGYMMGRSQASEMTKNGFIGGFKHFIGNDQETNRHGVATFMSEQTFRQSEAKPFEGVLTDGGSLGTMGSYNRIGLTPTSSSYSIMTTLLRNEWGFKGINITDSSKDANTYIYAGDALIAGTTLFNNDPNRSSEIKQLLVKDKNGAVWKAVRYAAKNFFYAYAHSWLINSLTENQEVKSKEEWWKVTIKAIDISLIVLTVMSVAGLVVFIVLEKKQTEGE